MFKEKINKSFLFMYKLIIIYIQLLLSSEIIIIPLTNYTTYLMRYIIIENQYTILLIIFFRMDFERDDWLFFL